MNKGILGIWAILLYCTLSPTPVYACDGGCPTVVSYYNGLFPQYQKHFIGLRWRFTSFASDLGHEGLGLASQTKESFHSFELMGRFYPHRRVQIMAFVPLNYNQMSSSSTSTTLVGLGDASVLAFYNIINSDFSQDSIPKKVKHNWLLGGGIKVPTGAFNKKDNDGILYSSTFQLGTGSVDFILSNVYTLRIQKFGINTNINYKINLANSNEYRLGNQLSTRLTAFGVLEHKAWAFVPQGGFQLEHNEHNYNKSFIRINSGGTQLLATLGLDIYFKKVQIGLSYEQPIWQQIAQGHIQNNPRFMANINYLF